MVGRPDLSPERTPHPGQASAAPHKRLGPGLAAQLDLMPSRAPSAITINTTGCKAAGHRGQWASRAGGAAGRPGPNSRLGASAATLRAGSAVQKAAAAAGLPGARPGPGGERAAGAGGSPRTGRATPSTGRRGGRRRRRVQC